MKAMEYLFVFHLKGEAHLMGFDLSYLSHVIRKPVYAICEQQRRKHQPAPPRSLISAFVVRYLESPIPILAKSKFSKL